jgi:hypothetical protein
MRITYKIMLETAFTIIFSTSAYAMRMAPKPVTPIDHNDVIYSVPHFVQCLIDYGEPLQNGGYILARDKKTKRIKWLVQIYVTKYNKSMETDVQDVFITEIKLDGETLMIKDEKRRTYSLNINTLETKPLPS